MTNYQYILDSIEKTGRADFVSDSLNRVLLDEASDPIFAFARNGMYLYVNNIFASTMLKKPHEIIGRKIWDIFPGAEGDHRFKTVKEVFETNEMRNIDVRVPTPNGDIFFLTTVKPVKNDLGETVFVLCISKNITEMKRVKEQLENAKNAAESANRAKSEFISNMSHEIRTPLNAVLGFSELLKETVTDKKGIEFIKGITMGGKSLLNIINDILDISKIEAGKMKVIIEPTNIYEVMNEIRQIFIYQIQSKNIELIYNIDFQTPKYLLLDSARIRQILLNIIGNAIKFTSKGYVKVSLECEKNPNGKVNIKFIIEDTGIGIPPEHQKEIFESFCQSEGQSTKKYGGTGLGLTITKKLVEIMNGKIEVESETGKGSKFSIEIKDIDMAVVAEDNYNEEIQPLNENLIFKKSRILYAEDVEANRKVLKGYVHQYGIDVEEASDGVEAFEKSKALKPDLIILDIHMPTLDGLSVLQLLKSEISTKNIPVIALSASTINKNIVYDTYGFNEYLEKPLDKRKLIEILKKYIDFEIDTKINKFDDIVVKDFELSPNDKEQLTAYIKRSQTIVIMEELENIISFLKSTAIKYDSQSLGTIADHLDTAANEYDLTEVSQLLNVLNNVI